MIERAAFACFSVFDISVVSVLFNISIFAFLLIRFISSLAIKFDPVMPISSFAFKFIFLSETRFDDIALVDATSVVDFSYSASATLVLVLVSYLNSFIGFGF